VTKCHKRDYELNHQIHLGEVSIKRVCIFK